MASYVKKARRRLIHETAAVAWSYGVPWAEALKAASISVSAGNAAAKPLAGQPKGRGKGKKGK